MDQQSFFPEEQVSSVSSEEMAAHIAAHAPENPYEAWEAREARKAEDYDNAEFPVFNNSGRPEAPTQNQKRPYEVPGRGRGRVNPYDQPVTSAEAQRGMSPESVDRQQAINQVGAALARAALNRDNSSRK